MSQNKETSDNEDDLDELSDKQLMDKDKPFVSGTELDSPILDDQENKSDDIVDSINKLTNQEINDNVDANSTKTNEKNIKRKRGLPKTYLQKSEKIFGNIGKTTKNKKEIK